MPQKTKVPQAVLDGIVAAQQSGAVNMHNNVQVQNFVQRIGHHETYLWIQEHPTDYYTGLANGFELDAPAPTPTPEPKPTPAPKPKRPRMGYRS